MDTQHCNSGCFFFVTVYQLTIYNMHIISVTCFFVDLRLPPGLSVYYHFIQFKTTLPSRITPMILEQMSLFANPYVPRILPRSIGRDSSNIRRLVSIIFQEWDSFWSVIIITLIACFMMWPKSFENHSKYHA